jgi:hypothetical protein
MLVANHTDYETGAEMKGAPSCYQAYLLRLWRVADGEKAIWRASLQDVRTSQRLGFARPNETYVFAGRAGCGIGCRVV